MTDSVPGVPAASRVVPGHLIDVLVVSLSGLGGVSRLSRVDCEALCAWGRVCAHALRNSSQNKRDSRDTSSSGLENGSLSTLTQRGRRPGTTRDAAGTPRDTPLLRAERKRRWSV